jgi:hypothetical protein
MLQWSIRVLARLARLPLIIGLVPAAIHVSSLKLAGRTARIPRQAGGMTVDR